MKIIKFFIFCEEKNLFVINFKKYTIFIGKFGRKLITKITKKYDIFIKIFVNYTYFFEKWEILEKRLISKNLKKIFHLIHFNFE